MASNYGIFFFFFSKNVKSGALKNLLIRYQRLTFFFQSQVEEMFGDAPDKMTYTEQANKRSHCKRLTSFIRYWTVCYYDFILEIYSRKNTICAVNCSLSCHKLDRISIVICNRQYLLFCFVPFYCMRYW